MPKCGIAGPKAIYTFAIFIAINQIVLQCTSSQPQQYMRIPVFLQTRIFNVLNIKLQVCFSISSSNILCSQSTPKVVRAWWERRVGNGMEVRRQLHRGLVTAREGEAALSTPSGIPILCQLAEESRCQPAHPVWPHAPPLTPPAWTAQPQGQQPDLTAALPHLPEFQRAFVTRRK